MSFVRRSTAAFLALHLVGPVVAQTPWTWAARGMYFDQHAAFTFDLVRQRTVGFGAFGTWELAGSEWLERPSAHAPSNRHGHALAWHPGTGQVVLFGGRGFDTFAAYLDDTWTWDGFDWTLRTTTVAPSRRRLAAAAHDLARDRVVLFGGTRDSGPLGDTWEWDGARWWATSPRNRPPDGRLANDLGRSRVALLATGPGSQLEHWEWDGAEWQQLLLPVTPPASTGFSLCQDLARGRLVLFVGANQALAPETWEWDGANWRQRQPATQPLPVRYSWLVHDPSRGRSLVLGGSTIFVAPPPTAWEWDGVDWRQGPATPSPPRMQNASFAYDPLRQRVVTFASDVFSVAGSGTWEWDGAHWTRRVSVPAPAGGRAELAWDPVMLETLLFGASPNLLADGNETWSWNGSAWRRLQPATNPGPRRDAVLVTDPVRARVVMFGGMDMTTIFQPLAETWEWDGFDWTLLQPTTSPPARMAASATFDDARGVLVLFGGEGRTGTTPFAMDDTWQWNGIDWRRRFPNTSPPPGSRHGMAFEPGRQQVVLFGGLEHHVNGPVYWITERTETWEWDGVDWNHTVGVLSPPGIARAIYEPAFARIMKASFTPSFYGEWPASLTDVGSGCGGANGPLRLAVSTPGLGGRVQFDVHARPGAPGLLVLSLGTQDVALGSGCRLFVDEPMTRFCFTVNGGGFATVGQLVPRNPRLSGVIVLAQAFALDATAPQGFGATQGVRMQLGN